jgi:uncharacterized membrane protein SpoIIM required for sporulation
VEYARFLELRRPVWQRFEAGLERARRRLRDLSYEDLEGLAFDYRRVLHDRALARQRYPGTEADRRLAYLALEGARLLTQDSPPPRQGILGFFRHTFPRTFQRHRRILAVVACLFLAVASLGLALTIYSPTLGLTFLGPEAEAGLREGRLWTEALTSTVPPAASSSAIATNNMSVALMAWTGGATAGLLTLWIVFLNGLMLGAVVGLTLHYSMAHALLEFISAHGPLEITLILVAATAGLVLARGLVVAEDRPRREVMRKAAGDSLTLALGCLPWFLLLGFVEGFLSPSTALSPSLKLTVGLSLEALFFAYALRPSPPIHPLEDAS